MQRIKFINITDLKTAIHGTHPFSSGTNIVDRDTFGLNTGFTVTYHFPVNGKFDLIRNQSCC